MNLQCIYTRAVHGYKISFTKLVDGLNNKVQLTKAAQIWGEIM